MTDQQEPKSSSDTNPSWVTILVALLAASAAIGTALYNADAQRDLERDQLESSLILKAVDTKEDKQSRSNLKFLIESGLIRRSSDKISRILNDSSFHIHFLNDKPVAEATPTFSYPTFASSAAPTFSGVIEDEKTTLPIKGATISISTTRSLRRPIETQTTDSSGRFTLHYPPRNYTLSITCSGYQQQRTWRMARGRFPDPLVFKMDKLN